MRVSEIIGKRVRLAREERGLSQRELGEQVGGVLNRDHRPWFPQAVSASERGERDWTADDLVAVAWVLGRPVQWFFTVDEGDAGEMLDFDGFGMIHASWAAGIEEPRSAPELVAEIYRLTAQLERQFGLVKPVPVTEQAGPRSGVPKVNARKRRKKS